MRPLLSAVLDRAAARRPRFCFAALAMRSRFPSLPRASRAFRRAICRRFRQPKFRFPIQRRRRSKIPATRRFRLLAILT